MRILASVQGIAQCHVRPICLYDDLINILGSVINHYLIDERLYSCAI